MYLLGSDVPKDAEKALYYLNHSAEHENIYAKQLLEQFENAPSLSVMSTVIGLFNNLTRIFSSRMNIRSDNHDINKKLSGEIAKKKAALSHKNSSIKMQ